jgi:hypothetical protein
MQAWPYATDKASVLERIGRSWASLDEATDGLSDEQMRSAGPDGWTVKDHLAHVAGWNLSLVALMERRHRQAALDLEGYSTTDWDGQNEVMLRRHRALVPDEVRALLLGSRLLVLSALRRLGDADLERPYREYQPHDVRTGPLTSDDPVVRYIVGTVEDHVEEHLASIHLLIDGGARLASRRVAVT